MATAVFTTVVDRSVGDPLTEAIWDDQLKDNLNSLAGSHRNLLTNGGFEVWQRGAGGFTADLAYTADRWQLDIEVGTATVTQETSVVDASSSSLKLVTAGGASSALIVQKIEDVKQLRGRTISFSARIQQSVASQAVLRITDSAGSSNGSAVATTGSFVTLTVSRAIGASEAGPLTVSIAVGAAGTYYYDNAMLVIGPAPAPYQPLHPAEELARCQRYFEVVGGTSNALYLGGYNAAGANSGCSIFHKVTKGGVPTITKSGTWNVTNCAQPTVDAPSPELFRIFSAITALGAFFFTPNSGDDYVTIEHNP